MQIEIDGRKIGTGHPCYIVAEIGINHGGDVGTAIALADAAVTAGANAVKLQRRDMRTLYADDAIDSAERGVQHVVNVLRRTELSNADFESVLSHCRRKGITFLCTPWDAASAHYLRVLRIPAFKIGSPDFTNLPLLRLVAGFGAPMLISTGMATAQETRRVIGELNKAGAFGVLLHCLSEYPTDAPNLRIMQWLASIAGERWIIGYSGHDNAPLSSAIAVALGACVIERHITLNKAADGPDHRASLEPHEFAEFVHIVRQAEKLLGNGSKFITRGELLNRRTLGKSLFVAVDIEPEALIDKRALDSRSPGLGISPLLIDEVVGQRAVKPIPLGTMLDLSHISREVAGHLPVNLPVPWGIIVRFADAQTLARKFAPLGASLLEFHLSDYDVEAWPDVPMMDDCQQEIVVHLPEYSHEWLIDLCSPVDERRRSSIAQVQIGLDVARQIADFYGQIFPKVVLHIGGATLRDEYYDIGAAEDRLIDSLSRLDASHAILLLENLPPHPWYFGGRWHGHVMVGTESIVRVCERAHAEICLDISHAALECNLRSNSLCDYVERVAPLVRHIHIADAEGTSGEGLQIGEGQIDWPAIMPLLRTIAAPIVPEIWNGHHVDGRGFRIALERLTEMWK